ncbi:hypothetical protein [Caulobacter segnis]|uniref:YCII-related domain-containing protein n=1 Tax=Caulobacter segnis TaxID=88688 RepID=A0A2W5X557_9CAUL|nr:hypothetical protein [Caulobacter segnis]PZR31871.1 MAG: hypothetical protein DI526_18285 [Caulobacter segnis]
MADYILLMHGDGAGERAAEWAPYIEQLVAAGRLRGGSAIGEGACFRRGAPAGPLSDRLTGFLRISAEDLEDAASCLVGNPVYETGGTVEIRRLPETN